MAGGLGPVGVELLDRGGEMVRIERAIATLGRGQGGVLVIQGAAGIGKSTLLRAVYEYAAKQQLQMVTAQASELERDFGFGMVRQLFEQRVARAGEAERDELLAGAAALAGPVLGLSANVAESFAALHGLYWLVANLSVGGPVVLGCDDLQWADEPSLRWLIYLCRRLEGLPVLVVVTTRPPRAEYSPLLCELLALSGAQILCPGPLSEPAVAQLIHTGLGTRPDPAFVAACASASGGNPFVLRELIFDLAADDVAPVAAQAAGLAERVPDQVGRAVLARLSRLDETAVQLARAVAVLGEGTGLRLAAALAELNIEKAAKAADALWAADLLAEGRPLRFVHPLVRSAVHEQLAPGARSQAHARAARLLIREGTGYEQIAAQLLLCEPEGDPEAVAALQAAAVAALERGAPDASVTYLRRALAEPPAESARVAVLGKLGEVERLARDPAAVVHLEQAWQATTDLIARVRLAGQLANALFYTGNVARSAAMLQTALDDLGDRDPDLAARLHADRASLELVTGHPSEAPDAALAQLRELAARNSSASRWAQLALAGLLAAHGESSHEITGLVERGWDNGRFLAEESAETLPVMFAVWALTLADELDRAHALAAAMLADAQARGSVVGLLAATGRRGLIALRRGTLAEAEADTRAAFELATEHKLAFSVPITAASLTLTLLERGELDQAAAVIEGISLGPMKGSSLEAALTDARGRVRLARGQRTEAVADLRRCGQLADQFRWHNPNLLAWRSTLALALAPGHPSEAWELAQAELKLARDAGAPRAIGVALRVCGLLADAQDRVQLLEQSVAVLEPSPARLELAHSLTELGAALRRAGARAAAREPLRRALDLAHRCSASSLATRAREEALATGARPRRPWTTGVQALTPSELRVARLAAQPMSNRDIAQALFITSKTVSDHLTSAYRKLNINTRAQLAAAMTAPAPPQTP